MKIRARCKKKSTCECLHCIRMITSTGRSSVYEHMCVIYVYYIYCICMRVKTLLLSSLLLS